MSRPMKASAQVKEMFAAPLPRNLNFTRAPGRIAFRSVTDRSRGSEAGRRRPGRYVIVVAAWRPRLSGREGNAAPSLHAVLHTGLLECDYGEGSEAGVQVPLLPDCSAGGRTVPNVRVRTEGIQPGARRPHRGVVPAGRAGLLRAVVRDADRLEALGRPGLPGRGVQCPAAAGTAALAGRVRGVLGEPSALPAVQVPQALSRLRRLHAQRVPLAGRAVDAGEGDGAALSRSGLRWISRPSGPGLAAERRPAGPGHQRHLGTRYA